MSSAPSSSALGSPGTDARMPALDGLRGFAVLLVLLDHASDSHLRLFPAADMNRAGKYGVYLFFVLSAFLLTALLLRRPAAELIERRTWLDYALRRFLRIFPLYALVLLVMVMNHFVLADLFSHLLLLDGKKQFWTIPVEVKYYGVLPFIVLTISGVLRRSWRFAAFGGAATLAVMSLVIWAENAWSYNEAVLLGRNLSPFILGTAAALFHRGLRPCGARTAAWLEAVGLGALLITFLRVPAVYNGAFPFLEPVHKFASDPLICGLLWVAVLLGALHGTGLIRRVFETRALRYLGLVSYSAYLWHQKFLTDVDDMPIPLPLRLLVFVGLVVGVASVSYFLVERPLSRIHYRRAPAVLLGEPVAVGVLLRTQ